MYTFRHNMKFFKYYLTIFVVIISFANMSFAQGNPIKGEKIFNKCKACHSALDTKNKIGPSLLGIVGKPAGEVTGYKYSKALLSSGVIWNEESLDAYLEKPKKFLPGGKMAFVGLRKEEDREDVIAYLKKD